MYYPDKNTFLKKAKESNLIPVYTKIIADVETPVSAFLKIKKMPYSFLLESVEGGMHSARYSFLGTSPQIIFKSKGEKVKIINNHKSVSVDSVSKKKVYQSSNPLLELKKILSLYKPAKIEGLPRFYGGAVGYISYDAVRFFENLQTHLPDDLNIPDIYFLITETLLIFDHLKHKIMVVCSVSVDKDPEKSYNEAIEKINKVVKQLRSPLKEVRRAEVKKLTSNFKLQTSNTNVSSADFIAAVKKAKKYIYAGDIVQVVLSQRYQQKINCPSFNIYRALRSINPSPYLFYLNFADLHLIGSSPEMLVRVEEGVIRTRPIAGTRPRGKTEKTDWALQVSLLKSKKEKAEHIMLVDLARNDVGRVAKFGTVKVSEFMKIEKYSHVMHIISEVVGKIKKSSDAYEVIKSCFPAGTVSGAPKVRAMEIIEELESSRRGIYAGCVGYFSFTQNMDTAIAIRTILVKDNIAYIQTGAGIVADSQPQKEYYEAIDKAKALKAALKEAEKI